MTRIWQGMARRPETQIAIIFVAVVVALQLAFPVTSVSIGQVLARATITGIVALGLTAVIIQGNFDLSVGSTFALAAIATIALPIADPALRLVAVLLLGALIGVLNGLIVAGLGINSLIATIATMTALQGIAFLITDSSPVLGSDIEGAIAFTRALVGFVTPEIVVFAVAAIIVQAFLSSSARGREFFAVGGNMQAARESGIPVKRRVVEGFIFSGVFAALAGWVAATQLNSANPNQGAGLALLAITAVVIGGTSLRGGRGSAVGTVLGAVLLAWIATTFDAAGLPPMYQDITNGLILLLIVAADQLGNLSVAARRHARRLQGPRERRVVTTE